MESLRSHAWNICWTMQIRWHKPDQRLKASAELSINFLKLKKFNLFIFDPYGVFAIFTSCDTVSLFISQRISIELGSDQSLIVKQSSLQGKAHGKAIMEII